MPDRNWMHIPHPELYRAIDTPPGPKANEPAVETYWDIGALFAQVQQDLGAAIGKIRSGYEGAGSNAAQGSLGGLEAWTADAQAGSRLAGQHVQAQSDAYINGVRLS